VPGKEVAHTMTYRVVFTKEDKEWTVVAPDVHPAHSWGPNLRSASDHIKEAIALVLDLPAGAERTIALDAEYQVEDLDNSESNVFRIARDARQGLKEAQKNGRRGLAAGNSRRAKPQPLDERHRNDGRHFISTRIADRINLVEPGVTF